jgi:RecB family exonuclease
MDADMTASPTTGASPAGLTLLIGPANSGKLGQALDWWQQRLAARPLFVVPTAPDARSLSAEMAQRAGALVGQAPAVTFDGLVRLLLRRSPRYVGELERSLLVSHLLHERPPLAPGFSPRLPGIMGVTGSLLVQLGDSARSAEEIERLLQRWGATDETASLLAADIQALFRGYRALRDRLGLTDRSDSIREALAAAGDWERPLALYGFTSLTPAQRRLIAALASATEVLLVFDYERARGRGLTTPDELAHWEAVALRTLELEPKEPAYGSPAVAYLERHFMDDGPRPEPPPAVDGRHGVRFLLASGQRNEAELAAEQVAGLIRAGVRPGAIAVIVRHMAMWGRLLGEVFASCGIPCEIDERHTVDETGLGHAFVAGLRGVAEDDPEAVFEYLRSPYCGLPLEQASDLHLTYLRQTARGVRALLDCCGPEARAVLDELLRVMVRRKDGAVVQLEAAQVLVRRMLVNGMRGTSETPAGARAVEDDSRSYRALQGALSGLSVHRRHELLPAATLRPDVLLPSLARMGVPGGTLGSEGAVQVLTALRARARRFDAVFVLGLVEGEFPGRVGTPALLTAAQRDRLDALEEGLFAPEVDQEEALFVRALSRARSHLFLSSRDADDGGGYAGQSYYWSHCKALLGVGEREHVHRTLADLVFDAAQAPSPRLYLRACAARGLEPHPDSGVASLSAPIFRRDRAKAGLLSGRVLDELAQIRSFGPSALESYLTCPFMWFVDRIVGLEDLEPALDRQLVGQLLHKVLSDTYQELRSVGVLPLGADHLALAISIAGPIVEALVDSDECPGTPAERRLAEYQLKRMAADLFAMEVAAGGSMTLVDTELEVGGRDGVDVGGVAIRGRIDRVDSTPGGELFIIDYKSGSPPDKRKIGTSEGLQLPLYMLALAGERPTERVIGGAYVSPKKMERTGLVWAGSTFVQGGADRGYAVMEEEELQRLLRETVALAREAAEGIRSGVITPRGDVSCPDWCRLGPVCRDRRGGRRHRR